MAHPIARNERDELLQIRDTADRLELPDIAGRSAALLYGQDVTNGRQSVAAQIHAMRLQLDAARD